MQSINKLKFPLNEKLTMITDSNAIFIGNIKFAGKDVLTIEDVYQRIYSNEVEYKDFFVSSKLFFDRSRIIAYDRELEKPNTCEVISIKGNRMPKRKMIHEEVFEKYGIVNTRDPDKKLKTIPKEWIKDLFKYCIDAENKDGGDVARKEERSFVVMFNSEKEANDFNERFMMGFIKHTNEFIKNVKNDQPKDYQRSKTIITSVAGTVVNIEG